MYVPDWNNVLYDWSGLSGTTTYTVSEISFLGGVYHTNDNSNSYSYVLIDRNGSRVEVASAGWSGNGWVRGGVGHSNMLLPGDIIERNYTSQGTLKLYKAKKYCINNEDKYYIKF